MRATTPVLDQSTLLGVRWLGTLVLAGVLAVGATGWLPAPPLLTAVGILGAAVALNLVQQLGPRAVTGPVLIGDAAVLTGMLASSGGVANPFTLLYLFPVLLAALVLPPLWSGVLAVVTTAAFAGLYLTSPAHHHMDMSTHLVGMVVAFGLTVPLLAMAVHRVRLATERAEEEALLSRQARDAAERLASLAGLAGGAAHELATPLSTILLIASELERSAEGEVKEDLQAIREEVDRCRGVLDQLAVDVGQAKGEGLTRVGLDELVAEAVGASRVEVDVAAAEADLPVGLAVSALRRLIGNARDASGPDGHVALTARCEDGMVRFVVTDDGPGMSPDVLARACDPFFSTKPAGQGRGLGLFFVQSLAHQLGGGFELASSPGQGTRAMLWLPGGPACVSS